MSPVLIKLPMLAMAALYMFISPWLPQSDRVILVSSTVTGAEVRLEGQVATFDFEATIEKVTSRPGLSRVKIISKDGTIEAEYANGREVAKTPAGKKAMKLLKNWLKKFVSDGGGRT